MSAAFLPLGPTEHFIKPRKELGWFYLGTSVTSPTKEAEQIRTPVNTDLLGPVQQNSIYHNEIHTVTTVLNRLDYLVYEKLNGAWFGPHKREDEIKHAGQLSIPVHDFQLLMVYNPDPEQDAKTFAYIPQGRMYYSVEPVSFRETTENSRLLEVGIVFRCYPLYRFRKEKPQPITSSERMRKDIERALNPLTESEGTDPLTAIAFRTITEVTSKSKPGCPLIRGTRVLSLYTENPEDWFE